MKVSKTISISFHIGYYKKIKEMKEIHLHTLLKEHLRNLVYQPTNQWL
jgi:hypothetical protein